jgi:hypothetical protein
MAKSVLAIYNGNDYQARVFWYQACQALNSDSKIEKVGFEIGNIKFFDDVATIYKSPVLSERNEPITADYWQVKYHVDASGILTHNQLLDPKFINSKASSILQRLRQVQVDFAPNGLGARFYFVSPWQIQHDDPLAKLVSQNGGEIRLDVLFSNSREMVMVRETWKKHLDISDNYELECVIRPLRILVGYPPLYQIRNTLNAYLISAGLLPIDEGTVSNPYDDLIRKLRGMGQSWFTCDDIEKICKREGLWKGREENHEKAIHLGIRSFTRWAENMENETHRMINLVPYFDGRSIRSTESWMEKIYLEIDGFFQGALKDRVLYSLRLDCHSSIAFGAGYLIGTKSGFEVAPIQKTVSGQSVWRTKSMSNSLPDMWSITDYKIREDASDIGVSIGITHSIADEVREYIYRSLPGINRIFECQLLAGVSGKAIEDGDHAYSLVQQLVQWLKKNRNNQEKQLTLHIFSAAPNGFMFFLGQQAKVLGPIKLYEHNFESPIKNDYLPSLNLPRE